jgi:predicted DNA-binding transcriptional regulator AlpA
LTTVWRLERDGKFPKRRKIGPGCVGYLLSELEEWLNNCERVA